MRMKTAQITFFKQAILKEQLGRCRLCRIRLSIEDACLDHCHATGCIRSVLCRNCNGIEGKVFNLARRAKREYTPAWWVERLLAYWEEHTKAPSGIYHPTHKDAEEKRLARNKKARKRRAKKK